ncbi:MAG: hypothetical protein NT154_12455 [Verrucomicrobia bacterium]|nr:hypothetical protein [Verrucomicrobiota bacterium]
MRHLSLISLLGTSLLRGFPSASQNTNTTSAKPKIGIMKFEVDTDLKPALSTFLYESFSGEMLASGAFTVVDWEQLDKVQKVVAQAQPNVSPEEARKLALHQLGLEQLYLGSLTKVGSKFYLTVKLLNLDLRVERSERLPVASEDDLEPAVIKLAKMLSSNPEQAKEIKAQLERQKAETDRWAEVQKNQTEESLAAFLKESPSGAMAAKAEKALETIKTQKQAKEVQQKATEAEARDKKAEAERLRSNIAGRWKVESEQTTLTVHSFGSIDHPFNGMHSGVVVIAQQGKNISFEALVDYLTFGGGSSSKAFLFKGSYESGALQAESKHSRIDAVIDESGNKLVGRWNYKAYGKSGKLELTRLEAEGKP